VRVTEDLVRLRDEETKSIAVTTALRADLRKQTRRVAALELDLQRRYAIYFVVHNVLLQNDAVLWCILLVTNVLLLAIVCILLVLIMHI
jgi:hypothetical protein